LKAFVTGASGFIGANLVRLLLEQGYVVRSLVRPTTPFDNFQDLDIEVVVGVIEVSHLSELMAGCQVLFHVAAHYSAKR